MLLNLLCWDDYCKAAPPESEFKNFVEYISYIMLDEAVENFSSFPLIMAE